MKNTYRIFLASSYQLGKERDEFEKQISRLNDELVKKKTYLETVIWEKLDSGNDPVRKQDFYNAQLKTCDILVLAYWGELGLFTNEEYQLAVRLFQEAGRPRIYGFKKTLPPTFALKPQNVANLADMEAVLYAKDKAQWPWEFDHVAGFTKKIAEDIRALFADPKNEVFVEGSAAKLLSSKGVDNPNVFIGRKEELKTIRERLGKNARHVLPHARQTRQGPSDWERHFARAAHGLWSTAVSRIRQPIESLFNWINEKTGLQNASKVRATQGLIVHTFGALATALLLYVF